MTTQATERRTAGASRVLCVDDNPLVTQALRVQIERTTDFEWAGCAGSADQLLETVAAGGCPEIVLLDIDMPGMSPFEAIGALRAICGQTRVLMFSGMVEHELIDRAIDAGAWGYIAKSDGERALLDGMRRVLGGEFYLSPAVQSAYGG